MARLPLVNEMREYNGLGVKETKVKPDVSPYVAVEEPRKKLS